MAVTPASLTRSWDTVARQTYTTASITVAAGKPVAIHIWAPETQGGANPPAPSVTGAGQTWTLEKTLDWDTDGTTRGSMWVLTTPATSGGSGTLSIDFTSGGSNLAACGWSVVEYDGADTTDCFLNFVDGGANGGNVTSESCTLAALAGTDSIAVGFFVHRANEATTPGTGFTELDDQAGNQPNMAGQVEYQVNVTTVDASWATSSAAGGIAYEVKAAAAGGSTVTLDAAPAGTGTVTAALADTRTFAASPSGAATIAASLAATRTLEAVASGAGTVAAALSVSKTFAASVGGTGTVAAAIDVTPAATLFEAVVSGTAALVADLAAQVALAAAAAGAGTVTAQLVEQLTLAAAVAGNGTVSGEFVTSDGSPSADWNPDPAILVATHVI